MENELHTPPNAPPSRHLAEAPLDSVDRLIADRASQLGDEPIWEHYSQIADEIALSRARWTLTSRLLAYENRVVQIEVMGDRQSETRTLTGTLAEVGDGWCRLTVRARDIVVAIAAIQLVAGPRDRTDAAVTEPPNRLSSWACELRRVEQAGFVVSVERHGGPALIGRVVLAAKDHLDLALLSNSDDARHLDAGDPQIVTIPVSAICVVERR